MINPSGKVIKDCVLRWELRFLRVDGEGFSFLLRRNVEKCNAVLEVEKNNEIKSVQKLEKTVLRIKSSLE